jgi:hypothetical protein
MQPFCGWICTPNTPSRAPVLYPTIDIFAYVDPKYIHSIQKSIDVQIQQASISCATNEKSTQLMIDKHILWSELPTKDRLNNHGESLVTEQWQLSTDYEVQHSSKVDWKVVNKAAKKTDLGPIPVFRWVWTVSVASGAGRLQCMCCLLKDTDTVVTIYYLS